MRHRGLMLSMRPFTPLVVTLLLVVACGDNYESSSFDAPPRPECSDNADNDGDGKIDFPDDLGCVDRDDDTEGSPTAPSCNDKRDNDGDGKIDYPDDPGCILPQSDTEVDDCPTGLGCPQCADGVDNDGNGTIDYPDDPGCAMAADAYELVDDATACGANMRIKLLPPSGMDTGTLVATSTSQLTTPCGGGGGAPAVAYVFHVSQPKVLVATTDLPITAVDTVLDLRREMCGAPNAHLACHNDISTTNKRSRLVRPLQPGTYYLIVEGSAPTQLGSYGLRVELLPGQGADCTSTLDCGPGLVCRIPAGSTMKVCSPPVCSDTLDDDGDGKIDYPNDPGCAGPEDDTESDVCATAPTDPACPLCANGVDDDGDGQTDYPDDATCAAASAINEACAQSEPVIVATTPQTMGTTVGAVNDFTPPPGSYNGHACSAAATVTHTAPDRSIQLDVPAMSSLSLKLTVPTSFNSAHVLLGASCTGMPIDCHDNPNNMVLSNVAAGRYYLIVDGFSTASGTFTLSVSGAIVNGESCEAPLAQSGAITCGPGHSCKGPAGGRTCQPAQCNDAMDNNGDGKIDYPADPGCLNKTDDSEDTVCPGPSCPKCADGLDNDGDSLIDYPADTGCVAASADNEGCAESDPIVEISMKTTTGTLVGATDDHDPRCVTGNFPDKIFTLDIPTTLQSLVIDTEGSAVDTVLSLMNRTCSEPSIACDDEGGVGAGDSLITRGNVSPGSYTIAVDAKNATLDAFILNVTGTILPGGSCEGALFQSGVLVCPVGFGCNGTPGSRKCTAAQCQDGIDNNSDGKIDFPLDPGCDSASDNSEVTVCPGPECPICSDGLDNDGDGAIDYPADSGCKAASGTSEGCVDLDPIVTITSRTTTGTLVGASDDHNPECVGTNGVDRLFMLNIPGTLQSLTIDTEDSVVDTVLSFMNSACEEPSLACDDEGGVGANDSLITRGVTPAGTYMIAVDAFSTTVNTFILNVSGVLVPGGGCEGPLVQAGVLSCPTGFACSGPAGSRACRVAECADGIDNNSDGKIDYPSDPGCDSVSDGTEDTVCPGPACPVCSDGLDNDGDGDIDYPVDVGCDAASGTSEGCFDLDPIAAITGPTTTGTLFGASNDHDPACESSINGVDRVFTLDLPGALQSLTIDTEGSTVDTVLSFMTSACQEPSLECDDDDGVGVGDSLITRGFVPAGRYTIAVDAETATISTTTAGGFLLNVSGVIAPGASCESPLVQAGALSCSMGFACNGPVGARTCSVSECLDGIDNNLDGRADFPDDPGCETFSDATEDTVCPGSTCPVCSDGIDNDADGAIDYPFDPSCIAASERTEACMQSELIGVLTQPITMGTTAGQFHDFTPTCGSSTHSAPDVAFQVELPKMVSLSFNLTGFDTAHALLNSTCGGTALACSDPALMALRDIAAGTYYLMIDGWSSGSGAWTLTTSGVVAPGQSCEGALFQSGAFTCAVGYVCGGAAGARTCAPSQCYDGLDNNADGAIDYPFDPGCASVNDDAETTVCPGPDCPVCSNMADDDADMLADFPADFGCSATGGTTEVFCSLETTPPTVITTPQTTGTFASPATDDYEQSCQPSTGNDRAYALRLPVPVATLVVDTLGSAATNTVVSVWDASCSFEFGCDDDSAPGTDNRSVLTLANVPSGNYAIQVDSFSSSTLGFLLNVKGTVAPGTACTSPLFTAGVLVCPMGTTCNAGTSTCQ